MGLERRGHRIHSTFGLTLASGSARHGSLLCGDLRLEALFRWGSLLSLASKSSRGRRVLGRSDDRLRIVSTGPWSFRCYHSCSSSALHALACPPTLVPHIPRPHCGRGYDGARLCLGSSTPSPGHSPYKVRIIDTVSALKPRECLMSCFTRRCGAFPSQTGLVDGKVVHRQSCRALACPDRKAKAICCWE